VVAHQGGRGTVSHYLKKNRGRKRYEVAVTFCSGELRVLPPLLLLPKKRKKERKEKKERNGIVGMGRMLTAFSSPLNNNKLLLLQPT